MPSSIILSASSRPAGNTTVVTNYLATALAAPSLDLSAHQIAPYSYENDYPATDDYLAIIERLRTIDHWILVTPIYWYTMSAQMKTFLDRFSDLLGHHQSLASLPTGKTLWVVAVGSDSEPVAHFFDPFSLSAEYLGMYYGGHLHTWLGRVPVLKTEVQIMLDDFAQQVKNKVNS